MRFVRLTVVEPLTKGKREVGGTIYVNPEEVCWLREGEPLDEGSEVTQISFSHLSCQVLGNVHDVLYSMVYGDSSEDDRIRVKDVVVGSERRGT